MLFVVNDVITGVVKHYFYSPAAQPKQFCAGVKLRNSLVATQRFRTDYNRDIRVSLGRREARSQKFILNGLSPHTRVKAATEKKRKTRTKASGKLLRDKGAKSRRMLMRGKTKKNFILG